MERADIIIKSKAIFDSVGDEPFEGFIAVRGNKIVEVCKEADQADEWIGETTEVIDCGDRLVMAGMIDSHMHFFDGIFQNSEFMCRDLYDCVSAKECVDVMEKFAKEHPDYERIVGMGWYIPLWEDCTAPDKHMLDAIESERPMYLMCADAHSFWLNSVAMEECGITADMKPKIGAIDIDENGETTGVVHEMEICGPCSVNAQRLPKQHKTKLITDFISNLSKHGITATTDMTALLEPPAITDEMRIIAELEETGKLNLRVNLYPSLGTTDDFSIVKEYRENFHSDMFRVAGLKTFVDGVHGNHTALQLEPYKDIPENRGASFYPYEVYRDQVREANREGFGVKLHCTGDGATHLALDAYGESHALGLDEGVRNSIEHVEVINPEDIKRMAEYNVTAAIQPIHMIPFAEHAKDVVGEERAKYLFAINTMISEGVNVAFGTDYPVVTYDPRPEIYFAVTRHDLEGEPNGDNRWEKISLAEALKAYTAGSAYCLNMEKKIGTIEKGKLADIIVFDRNLFTADSRELLETEITMTVSDGRIVYRA